MKGTGANVVPLERDEALGARASAGAAQAPAASAGEPLLFLSAPSRAVMAERSKVSQESPQRKPTAQDVVARFGVIPIGMIATHARSVGKKHAATASKMIAPIAAHLPQIADAARPPR